MTDNKELIVNFSGGKDSTAMLHLLLEHGEKVDEVIYFDGGWEFPQMADHVALVEEKTGIKITRLYPRFGNFDWWGTQYEFCNKQGEPRKGYGWAGSMSRWCTREKMLAMKEHVKDRNVIQCIGFAVGEERRLLKGWNKVYTPDKFRFPLIEDYNFDEKECLHYCYKLGYTWGGLYEYFDRVSCFCCPLQGVKDCLMLKRHFPELWQAIKEKSEYFIKECGGARASASNWRNEKGFDETDIRLRGKDEDWDIESWFERMNIKQAEMPAEPIDKFPTLFDEID